jgi:hypothetical protein
LLRVICATALLAGQLPARCVFSPWMAAMKKIASRKSVPEQAAQQVPCSRARPGRSPVCDQSWLSQVLCLSSDRQWNLSLASSCSVRPRGSQSRPCSLNAIISATSNGGIGDQCARRGSRALAGKTLNPSIESLGVLSATSSSLPKACHVIKPAAPSYDKFVRIAFHAQAEERAGRRKSRPKQDPPNDTERRMLAKPYESSSARRPVPPRVLPAFR